MNDVRQVPGNVQDALRAAMKMEGVSSDQFDDYVWIIAQESGGKIGNKNRTSSARGLFQLTHSQYNNNPNGIKSFGNATEEARGGIRYVRQRYQNAATSRAFWERHGWY